MDKRSVEPLSSIMLPSVSHDGIRAEAVVAVHLNAVAIEAANFWRRLVRERVACNYRKYLPPDSKRSEESVRLGHLERLLDYGELAGISEIWLNSPYVNDAELVAAGRQRPKPLTRQSLSRRIKKIAECHGENLDMSVYEARATRLVEAMLCHDLVEEDVVRPNYKPLQGTVRLHALMTAYYDNYALLLMQVIGASLVREAPEGNRNG